MSVPESVDLPEQPPEITLQTVKITPELRELIRSNSSHCAFIEDRLKLRIRERYSPEDEYKFARLALIPAIGGDLTKEQLNEIQEYNGYVKSCIEWSKSERKKLGL